jgi:dTDP-4-amino-4,6-dideoxygalactose transaminase
LTSGVPFFKHDLGQPELEAIAEVIAGSILTTGETVACFENEFAAYLGRKHALGVTSCTGAMHMALLALGVGPGDEVITTPMTFVATAGAIAVTGAKPVFVDVEADTGNLDVGKIERAITSRTKAILPVHLFGLMCDMRAIRKIADRHSLSIIEDSAHCIEGSRDGVRPGELSDAACFSFFATKNITCGEGGALVTERDDLVEKFRLLRLHGMARNPTGLKPQEYAQWDMVMLGWKYNMDNLQAALLLPQMRRIDSKLSQRHALAAIYQDRLRKIAGVRLPATRAGVVHARHMYPVWVDARIRDAVVNGLINTGIGAIVPYRAIHLMSYFQETLSHRAGDFPVAERVSDETIALPFYPTMTEAAVHFIVDTMVILVERCSMARL